MAQNLNGKLVTCGEFLADAEEYVAEDITLVFEEQGKLFASITGIVVINPLKRTITIKNEREAKQPAIKLGDIVIGRVEFERKFNVGLKIFKVNQRFIYDADINGNVHISNVSRDYVESLSAAYRMTDLVRGKVIGVGKEYELSTNGPKLGVVHADCLMCGTRLARRGRNYLECPFCGKKENRVLANDYEQIDEKMKM
jgi:exosome complex RNA-binding protein Csl4